MNNYFGRQFNSLNDVAIHPTSKEVYFTDTAYGYLQNFRPVPGLRNQVYRMNPETGAVTVVADGYTLTNGRFRVLHRPTAKMARLTKEFRHNLLPRRQIRLRHRHRRKPRFFCWMELDGPFHHVSSHVSFRHMDPANSSNKFPL